MPFDRFISRHNTTKEGISKLKRRSREVSQTKTQREKRVKETKQNRPEHSDLWDNHKRSNIV